MAGEGQMKSGLGVTGLEELDGNEGWQVGPADAWQAKVGEAGPRFLTWHAD